MLLGLGFLQVVLFKTARPSRLQNKKKVKHLSNHPQLFHLTRLNQLNNLTVRFRRSLILLSDWVVNITEMSKNKRVRNIEIFATKLWTRDALRKGTYSFGNVFSICDATRFSAPSKSPCIFKPRLNAPRQDATGRPDR